MQIKWYINEQYVHQPVLYHRMKDHVSKFYEGPNRRWGPVSQLCEAGFWVAVCSAAVPPLLSTSAIHKPSRKTLALTCSLSPERGLFQCGFSVIFQTPPMGPRKYCLFLIRCHLYLPYDNHLYILRHYQQHWPSTFRLTPNKKYLHLKQCEELV